MVSSGFRESKFGVEARTEDSISNLISAVNIRRDDPKDRAREIFGFLNSHGNSQLEELSKRNLLALHIKAFVNDARIDIHGEEISRRFGDDFTSREREEQTFKHLRNVKAVLEIYEQVQKFSNEGNTALELWIRMNSALMLKFYLEGTEIAALEYMGLEDQESVFEKRAAQEKLIEVYLERMHQFGDNNEVAGRWLDRFNRRLYREMCMPYMLNAKIIKSPAEFEEYQRPHLPSILKEALIDIAAEKRQ